MAASAGAQGLQPDVASLAVADCSLQGLETASGSSLRARASAPCPCPVSAFSKGLRGRSVAGQGEAGPTQGFPPKAPEASVHGSADTGSWGRTCQTKSFLQVYPALHMHILKSRDLWRVDSLFSGASQFYLPSSWPALPLFFSPLLEF